MQIKKNKYAREKKIKNGAEILTPTIWGLYAKQSQALGWSICPAEMFSH